MLNVPTPGPPTPARRLFAAGHWPPITEADEREAQAVIAYNIAKRAPREALRELQRTLPIYVEGDDL